MSEIKLRSYVGKDGILHLDIPVDVTDAELEVTVTFKIDKEMIKTPEELGWSPGFFEKTAGAWKGEPLARREQGDYPIRLEEDITQLEWHEFLEKTAGACADDPIIIDSGGIDESLDDNLESAFD